MEPLTRLWRMLSSIPSLEQKPRTALALWLLLGHLSRVYAPCYYKGDFYVISPSPFTISNFKLKINIVLKILLYFHQFLPSCLLIQPQIMISTFSVNRGALSFLQDMPSGIKIMFYVFFSFIAQERPGRASRRLSTQPSTGRYQPLTRVVTAVLKATVT